MAHHAAGKSPQGRSLAKDRTFFNQTKIQGSAQAMVDFS
jgi:hypothetical protein